MAPEFVGALDVPEFKAGVSLVYELVRKTEAIDWVVTIPENGRVEATFNVWPNDESGD
jgi:hypothetical protein